MDGNGERSRPGQDRGERGDDLPRELTDTAEIRLAHADLGWTPELSEVLRALLRDHDRDRNHLVDSLAELAEEHGSALYSVLFHIVAHLSFEPEVARDHWRDLALHWRSFDERMGAAQDVRVALVSYFLDVAETFENPTIIEMRLLEETRQLAYRDELTGLHNFRYFSEAIVHEIRRSDQYGAPLSLVMIDVDNFKPFNDRFEHQAGNRALATIGSLLRDAVRRVDISVRYGGEEFALLLSSTPKTGAQQTAERARVAIEECFAGDGDLTVSLGVATYPGDATDQSSLVRNADRALYLAKEVGKNRVCLYGESRRSYRRVDAALDGTFRGLSPDRHPLQTLNLSEGGLRFQTAAELEANLLIDVRLTLPDGAVEMAARVTQVVSAVEDGSKQTVAARILEMSAGERIRLRAFIEEFADREES